MRYQNRYFFLLSLSTLLFSLFLYFYLPSFLQILELKSVDWRFHWRGNTLPSQKVVIVAIDEESLEKVGRWPWSRTKMAQLVKKIDAASPLAVGYDIGFFEPEVNVAQKEVLTLFEFLKQKHKLDKESQQFLEQRLLANYPDYWLARALLETNSTQVLGYYLNFEPSKQKQKLPLNTAKYTGVKLLQPESVFQPLQASKVRSNLELLLKAAGKQGYFNVVPDEDGSYRRYPLVLEFRENYLQPLALSLFNHANKSSFVVVGKAGILGVEVGKVFVPTDERGFLFLNYRGKAQTILHLPAWKILAGEIDPSLLQGKYVLVGVTAPGVYDLRVTPFGVAYPGLEIQATALDNLLQKDYLLRPGFAPLFDLVAIILLWLGVSLALFYLTPFFSLMVSLILGLSFIGLNFYFFTHKLYLLNLGSPLLTLVISYVVLLSYRILFADKQKKNLRKAFSKYLDAKLVEEIVKEPDKLKLGGEKRELTVLFSDIRGFTTLSEKLAPEELVSLLNKYLTEMTQIILQEKGLLDKYIGDAIMAIFGTPIYYPEHALCACKSALSMLLKLEELNTNWKKTKGLELNIGIGINTGEMVAGNMGSIERFDYTVMGDNVNLASRLEGLNKYYGTNILVSEFTYEQVKEHFSFRLIDKVRVKGKEKPVKLYELLPEKKATIFQSYKEEYEEFLSYYFAGEFEAASEKLLLLEGKTRDKLWELYKERLKVLRQSRPENWDGVYTFAVK
ncbi:MAG: adenylate cyclase [Desulfonauticus sp.]|nr:MAG: Adenylate cyclase [Desulfonauticus sp. 38_4375]MDK2920931.1 adenylate cyclase [Desulfonauticus sp.]